MAPRKKLSERERKRRQRRSQHNQHLKRTYGITIDEYDTILAAQGGRCAICLGGTSRRHFAVDHNHKTGNVRGLLCGNCNGGLRKFRDSAHNLFQATKYLTRDGSKVRVVLGREVRVPEEPT